MLVCTTKTRRRVSRFFFLFSCCCCCWWCVYFIYIICNNGYTPLLDSNNINITHGYYTTTRAGFIIAVFILFELPPPEVRVICVVAGYVHFWTLGDFFYLFPSTTIGYFSKLKPHLFIRTCIVVRSKPEICCFLVSTGETRKEYSFYFFLFLLYNIWSKSILFIII